MNQSPAYLAIAVAALLAGGALLLRHGKPAQTAEKAPTAASRAPLREPSFPSPPSREVRALKAPVASAAPTTISTEEAAFMTELRDLLRVSPGRALALARSGEQRFGATAVAAERSWVIVKALSELGRHDEARAEGKKLVEGHPGTRWSEDVHRHLFVNPPTHPFERGYGKTLEGE